MSDVGGLLPELWAKVLAHTDGRSAFRLERVSKRMRHIVLDNLDSCRIADFSKTFDIEFYGDQRIVFNYGDKPEKPAAPVRPLIERLQSLSYETSREYPKENTLFRVCNYKKKHKLNEQNKALLAASKIEFTWEKDGIVFEKRSLSYRMEPRFDHLRPKQHSFGVSLDRMNPNWVKVPCRIIWFDVHFADDRKGDIDKLVAYLINMIVSRVYVKTIDLRNVVDWAMSQVVGNSLGARVDLVRDVQRIIFCKEAYYAIPTIPEGDMSPGCFSGSAPSNKKMVAFLKPFVNLESFELSDDEFFPLEKDLFTDTPIANVKRFTVKDVVEKPRAALDDEVLLQWRSLRSLNIVCEIPLTLKGLNAVLKEWANGLREFELLELVITVSDSVDYSQIWRELAQGLNWRNWKTYLPLSSGKFIAINVFKKEPRNNCKFKFTLSDRQKKK